MKTFLAALVLVAVMLGFGHADVFSPTADRMLNPSPDSGALNYSTVAIGAAGAAVTKTLPAITGDRYAVGGIAWSLSAAPSSPVTLTISDGATVIDTWYIINGGPSGVVTFPKPIRCTAGNAATATISAPGGSIIATVNFYGVRTE